ncbi:hypothetical protein ACFU7Y_16485 [Kitasatospora sp. NPDC057542]|uniref:hypothetical protein n=1 Tax=Streptomycetaceae TaxID=2062 RepID=UPI001CCAFE06|nr:hypothetical protein [Streptomyces sp. LS1784]
MLRHEIVPGGDGELAEELCCTLDAYVLLGSIPSGQRPQVTAVAALADLEAGRSLTEGRLTTVPEPPLWPGTAPTEPKSREPSDPAAHDRVRTVGDTVATARGEASRAGEAAREATDQLQLPCRRSGFSPG